MLVFTGHIRDTRAKITGVFHVHKFREQGQHHAGFHVSCMNAETFFFRGQQALRQSHRKPVCSNRQNFVFNPQIARDDVHRSMVGELVDRLFAGDAKALVSHLLTEGDLDAGELEELRRIVDRAKGDER